MISRDPFARTELHRVVVPDSARLCCAWCGMPRSRLLRSNEPAYGQAAVRANLFRYETQSDGGRTSPHEGLFCSKSCHDSCHS